MEAATLSFLDEAGDPRSNAVAATLRRHTPKRLGARRRAGFVTKGCIDGQELHKGDQIGNPDAQVARRFEERLLCFDFSRDRPIDQLPKRQLRQINVLVCKLAIARHRCSAGSKGLPAVEAAGGTSGRSLSADDHVAELTSRSACPSINLSIKDNAGAQSFVHEHHDKVGRRALGLTKPPASYRVIIRRHVLCERLGRD